MCNKSLNLAYIEQYLASVWYNSIIPSFTYTCFVFFFKQVKSGTIFDNILVTNSVEHAESFAKETFDKTKEGEKKMKDEQDEKERKEREEEEKKQKEEEAKKKAEEEDEEEEEEEEVRITKLALLKL